MTEDRKNQQVEEYVAALSPEVRSIVDEIRSIVRRSVPNAEETFSYRMPAFRDGKIFMYIGAFKKHIGIFPPLRDAAELDGELEPFRGPKGNLKFPFDRPMPYDLINRVVQALRRQI